MKRALKIFGFMAVALFILGAAAVVRLKTRPVASSPLWTETVERTPERIARGAYLAEHVAVCVDCHSRRDFSRFAGPPVLGTLGGGGDLFGHAVGVPGEIYVPNITPDRAQGVGAWSDGELVRAIREGVARDGEPLAPMMPYGALRAMSDEDVRSVVAYVRGMSPVASAALPPHQLDFPLSLFVRGIPQPAGDNGHVPAVAPAVDAAYGRYLVTIASCADCHTRMEKGERVPGMDFAGGFEFAMPWGTVRSANITPDATGIGGMTEDAFVQRFHAYRPADGNYAVPAPPAGAQPTPGNTIMPWVMYAGMTDDDLRAIYRYLRTVPAVHNVVPRAGT